MLRQLERGGYALEAQVVNSEHEFCNALARLVSAADRALREAEARRARTVAEQRLRDIVDTVQNWIWECDASGRYTFSSPSITSILGYHRNDVLGRSAIELVDPRDAPALEQAFRGLADGRPAALGVVLRIPGVDGELRWIKRHMIALRDAAGRFIGARGTDRNITLRMEHEA